MNINEERKCKVSCNPRGFNVCCYDCEFNETCEDICTYFGKIEHEDCIDREVD